MEVNSKKSPKKNESSFSSSSSTFSGRNVQLSAENISPRTEAISSYTQGNMVFFSRKLDLSQQTHLKTVELGNIHGTVKTPSTIEKFSCGEVAKSINLTLEHCPELKTVHIGKVHGCIVVGPNVTHFECKHIEANAVVDLSLCSKLTTIKIDGHIEGILKVPLNVTNFKCQNIEFNAVVDLSLCSKLETIETWTMRSQKLPIDSSLTRFKCVSIESINFINCKRLRTFEAISIGKYSALNLFHCTDLISVEIKHLGGEIMLPRGIKSFICENLGSYSYNMHTTYTSSPYYRNFPYSSVSGTVMNVNTQVTSARNNVTLGLTHCTELTSLSIKKLIGTVFLSKRYHAELIKTLKFDNSSEIMMSELSDDTVAFSSH